MKIKISLSLIYKFLKNYYPWILGGVLVLLMFLNLFIYYQYVYLVVKEQPEQVIEKVVIDEETLQNVLNNLDERKENLFRVKRTSYFSPFIY